jgi:hypothetical protein
VTASADADATLALVSAISPLLEGKPSQVQGAVLADLLAMWLAGHVNQNNPDKSDRIRKKMLDLHLEAVHRLVEINYQMIIKPQLEARRAPN